MNIKLKDILNKLLIETPDDIWVNKKHLEYDKGSHVYYIYHDFVDKKEEWIAYDIKNKKIIAQNPKIVDEIYNVNKNKNEVSSRPWPEELIKKHGSKWVETIYTYDNENIKDCLSEVRYAPTHEDILKVISCLRRSDDDRDNIKADGRLFFLDGKYYFAFWSNDDEIIMYRKYIIDFINSLKINQDDVFIENGDEDEYGPATWSTFKKFLNIKEKRIELSPAQKKLKQIKRDLHINKGVLDKAILQVLQTQPKSTHDIVAGLEKKLGMSIAQIRHIYGELPLGRVGKALKEYIQKL